MASNTVNLNTWGAKRVFGDNQSQNPAGALLNSGAGRADNSTTGDTWIFLDTIGGTSSPWGFKHSQGDNGIKFFGGGTHRSTIWLGESKITATTFDGNATTATHLSSASDSTKFYRGDKTWSNTLTGKMTITLANGNSGEYTATRNTTTIWMGIGTGNENHGLYSNKKNDWMIYCNASGNVIVNGNATTATKFASTQSITLTGDTTGTASSQAGWSITTTTTALSKLANASAADLNAWRGGGIAQRNAPALDDFVSSGLAKNDGIFINIPWSTAFGQQIYIDDNSWRIAHRYLNGVPDSGVPNWSSWKMIVSSTGNAAQGSSTQPVYVDANGQVQTCTAYSNASVSDADTLDGRHGTGYMRSNGNDTSLGQNSPAATVKTYFLNTDKVPNSNMTAVYCNSGTEYAHIFSRTNNWGSVIRWTYSNKYMWILRYSSGAWQSDDFEKMSAGYADTAGSADSCTGNAATCTTANGLASLVYSKRANHSGDTGIIVQNTDSTNPLQIGYIIGTSGNGGIYDFTHSAWKVQIAPNGTTTFNGTSTACSGNAATAYLLYYRHINEINFKGGRQANCYFNYRDADSDGTGTAQQVTYYFQNYAATTNGIIKAGQVHNAVWNDFAEFRESKETEPGRVLISNGKGQMILSNQRLVAGAKIITDTFGCSVGESDTQKTPLGVAGRVLAYTYQPRENYKVGDCVCSAPNGTIDIMTRDEIKQYPDRIIGIVDEVPVYEKWEQYQTSNKEGEESVTSKLVDVEVKGRIWIYVR